MNYELLISKNHYDNFVIKDFEEGITSEWTVTFLSNNTDYYIQDDRKKSFNRCKDYAKKNFPEFFL